MRLETYTLAESAYLARRADELLKLAVALRNAQEKIAATIGASGAPGFMFARKLGGEHIRQQCTTAAEELMRACCSTGERPTPGELEACWRRLMAQTRTEAGALLRDFLLPHEPGNRDPSVNDTLDSAEAKGSAIVFADFAHFVAERDRDERGRRWKVAAWFGAAFAGAFLAKLPDLVAWIVHR